MQKQNQLSPEKYIINKGALLPFHECFVNEEWEERGMATVVLSKKMPSGKLIIGLYLIDTYCLGLKDTTYKFAFDDIDYIGFLNKLNESQTMVKCEPNFAHNLIYGAIDYADESGFTPNKDFRVTKHLLDTALIDEGVDEIEFGKDGKPLFVAGPHDDINRIIGILERNVGTGNYDYILPA
jgi:hypothetical protein